MFRRMIAYLFTQQDQPIMRPKGMITLVVMMVAAMAFGVNYTKLGGNPEMFMPSAFVVAVIGLLLVCWFNRR